MTIEPVQAGPLAGVLTTALIGSTAAGTALGGIVTGVLTLGLTIGANFLFSAIFGKDQTQQQQEIKTTLRRSVGNRQFFYGKQNIGGYLAAAETKDGSLHQIIVFGAHRFHDILEWWMDTRTLTLDGGNSGTVTSQPYPPGSNNIEFRIGDESQTAYDSMISAFPTLWTSDHKGNGMMHAHVRSGPVDQEKILEVYPNKIPQVAVIAETAEIYDPRTGTTGYDTNFALFTWDYLTSPNGLQIPASKLDVDDFIEAANDCGDILPTKDGGTISRYHGAFNFSADEEPIDVLSRLMTHCDGDLRMKPNGKIGFRAGKWKTPTVYLDDTVIGDFQWADGAGPLATSNEIKMKYVEPREDWPTVEADPWRNETDISEYGEVRTKDLNCLGVRHHNHARRLMKISAYRSAPRWRGELRCNIAGLRAWGERWIHVTVEDMGIADFVEIEDILYNMDDDSVTIKCASFDPAAYDFDPATEEGTAPVIPEKEDSSFGFDAPDLVATPSFIDIGGGVYSAAIFVSWTDLAPPIPSIKMRIQYRKTGDTEWQSIADVPSGTTSTQIGNLDDGQSYEVRGMWSGPKTSPWTTLTGIETIAYVDPPMPVQVFNANATTGEDVAHLTTRTSNDDKFFYYQIFRSLTTDIGDAVEISGPQYAAPNSLSTYDDEGLDPDTYYYWCVAYNRSNVPSTAVGPRSVTIEEAP